MKKALIYVNLFLLIGCNSINQEKLIGVWKLSKIEDPRITEIGKSIDANYSNYMAGITDRFLGFSYINFYNNNNFTSRMGSVYFAGNWKYDKKLNSITLTSKERNDKEFQISYNIKDFSDNKITLTLDSIGKNNEIKIDDSIDKFVGIGFSQYLKIAYLVCEYNKDSYEYKDKNDDIYSLNNNLWRVKPLNPESNEQIKARLKASINYLILYINNIVIREEKTMNTYAILSPIKIASNGIALKDETELPEEWLDVFYDKTQALEAYKLLVKAFSQDIKINEHEKWSDLDIDLLKQVNKIVD